MRILKLIGKIFLGLLGIILLFALYIQFGYNVKYARPYPAVQISLDSTRIARGEYLVRGPAHCEGCHSGIDSDDDLKGGKKVPLKGGRVFELPFAKIYTKNLTPDTETGIGQRTDGELARILRYAVDSKGHSILPFMPYANMSDEDISAIISYLRAQEPVQNEVPESSYNLLGKAVKWFMIKPSKPDPTIDQNIQPDSTIAYGRYLAYGVANCAGCHTRFNMQKMSYDGLPFSGGMQMEEKIHRYSTPNLTPDPKTGHITQWGEAQFIQRFQAGRVFEDSPMPWEYFAKMNERDVKAIYRFLQSLDPVENNVGIIVQAKSEIAE